MSIFSGHLEISKLTYTLQGKGFYKDYASTEVPCNLYVETQGW